MIREILEKYNLYDYKYKLIHITGTNGKGSVGKYISTGLFSSGKSVGHFQSPHILKENERISYNLKDINDSEFEIYKGKVLEIENKEKVKFTYFEKFFIMAMLYFKDKNPEYVVMEVGIGAKDDVTNLLNSKRLCVFTKISIDHKKRLGNTIEDIAKNKSHLMRDGVDNVSIYQKESVEEILKQKAKGNIDFVEKSDIKITKEGFFYKDYYFNKKVPNYKIENISLSIRALEKLDIQLDDKILNTILNTNLIARFQIVRKNPTIIVDGAHNDGAITSLFQNFDKKIYVIFQSRFDKDIEKSFKIIKEKSKEIVITDIKDVEGHEFDNYKKMELEDAINYFLDKSSKDDIILITGSLYLAADALKILE